eukprot:7445741-Ditylum_brightwellii.AAC.1
MENHLIDHHQHHFHQAYDTPFTIHLVRTLIIEHDPLGFLQGLKDNSIMVDELKILDFSKDMLKWLTPSPTDPLILEYHLHTI